MTIGQALLPEFDLEMAKTREILECVPEEQFEWAPHVKSFTFGKLVNHIAVIPGFAAMIVNGQGKRTGEAKSNIAVGRTALVDASDEHLLATVPVTMSFPDHEQTFCECGC